MRFPLGLATGDAGWTTAGNPGVKWVVHTPTPNRNAGDTDRAKLVSAYRRSLEVADELGAQRVAFPLLGAGIYGWPKQESIQAALKAISQVDTGITEIEFVVLDRETARIVDAELAAQ